MHKRSIALATAATLGLGGVALAQYGDEPTITGKGIGKLELGDTVKQLRRDDLIKGKLTNGCEFASPVPKTARLKAPLRGVLELNKGRVQDIVVFKGATARGVGPGSTLDDVTKAFPKAKVDRSLEKMFGATEVRVSRKDGGPFAFSIPVKTGKVDRVGIPFIPTCE